MSGTPPLCEGSSGSYHQRPHVALEDDGLHDVEGRLTVNSPPLRLRSSETLLGAQRKLGRTEMPEGVPLVLLVESDQTMRLNCANGLLDDGFEVVECESAIEAMHILEGRDDFDAMVADIDPVQAPGGLALTRYAARHRLSMKILIGSRWAEAQIEADAIIAAFLPKPYFESELVSELRMLLGQSPKEAKAA